MEAPEPVAVIGMACRFAGGISSPSQLWELLREGRDVVGQLPEGRWDWYASQGAEYAAAVRDVTKRGAFLSDIRGFDAEFFDITPREAALMDPQQRMALELAWEALEHAGLPPEQLAGTDAGVFMGVGADDYGRRLLEDLPRVEAWTGIGGAYCGVANRVSYVLDLRGPSMAVDTACSSSLVSIHLAAQALRGGECQVALAGGVLVMAAPGLSLVLDAAGATSPDGRCKSFDAAADGYGRGEGGGVVVLKRLRDARRDGDRVLAVIRGSAVHQDGRTNGIMAPNGQAQASLLRRAYEVAGVDPATVSYVEAHGTGTRAGDPLEAGALAEVVGAGRPPDQPCLIGSIKPNVGHLEAGAGVAGVIKTVLALRHREIPPSLNFTDPTPAVAWASSGLQVVTEPTPWPPGRPRRAGVSAYGYGGTIAHVILEQADESPEPPPATHQPERDERPGPKPYLLCGASPAAVAAYAGRLADFLVQPEAPPLTDVGYTLAHHRSHLPHRAVVCATDREQLVGRLRSLAGSGTAPAAGQVSPSAGAGLVWVFSGHGSQWIGMARELLRQEPVFAGVVDELAPVFLAEIGWSPRAILLDDAPQPVDVIQPMIFVVQTALAAVWQSYGVSPSAIIGHSVGEIAAAVTAGVLSREQGARLVCRRSLLLRRVAGQGGMAMVDLPASELERRLGGRTDVAVAVAAARGSAVISGDRSAVEELSRRWQAEGLQVRAVDSDVAFHSPHMAPLVDELTAAAADLPPAAPRVRLYSTALADPRSPAPRDGRYWATNLREQVRFAAAVEAAAADGYRLFVEISPHPVVEHSINETLAALEIGDGCVAHTLRRRQPERETLLTNLGLLYCHGAAVDWSRHWPAGRLVDLPPAAWQRTDHWAEEPPRQAPQVGQHDPASHTLLGRRIVVSGTTPAHAWLTRLDYASRPYAGEHPVRDVEIVPAAVLLTTLVAAGTAATGWPDLVDVALRVPVTLTRARELQVVTQGGTARLSSRIVEDDPDDQAWVLHSTAALEPASGFAAAEPGPDSPPATTVGQELPQGYVLEQLAHLGVAGMGFPWEVERLERGSGGLTATVSAGPARADATTSDATAGGDPSAPPAGGWAPLLDAALSIAAVAFSAGPPMLRMPARIQRVVLARSAPPRARITVAVTGSDTVNVQIVDPDGNVAARLTGLRYGVLDSDAGVFTHPRRLVHELVWRPLRPARTGAPRRVVLVGPTSRLRDEVTGRLAATGVPHAVVSTPEQLGNAELDGTDHVLVVPTAAEPGAVAGAVAAGTWLLARTAQRLAQRRSDPPKLWCLTQGLRECDGEQALGYGGQWGLGRVIGGEHPELWGGAVDIGQPGADLPALLELLAAEPGEDVVVIRGGELSVPRLQLPEGEPGRPLPPCRPDGTYLITGGLGALGRQVARYLADRGARRLLLVSRRALPPRDQWDQLTDPLLQAQVEEIRSLERLGVTVTTVAADVGDPDAVRRVLVPATHALPPVRGVVHTAGVLDNRSLQQLDEQSLRKVLKPKVDGAMALHTLYPPGSVDLFVLFSSCGQLLGLPGQASYAAGNAFLDALAAHRRAAGDPAAVSIGWTSWRGLGMSTSSAVIDMELAARGTADINATEAFAAWGTVERYQLGYAAVLRTLPQEPGERRLPLLRELTESRSPAPAAPSAVAELHGLTGRQRQELLVEQVCALVAAETRLLAGEVDPRRPLVEMGIDSVMTVRIRRALERRYQVPLPTTLFWDHPTTEAVAAVLGTLIGGDDDDRAGERAGDDGPGGGDPVTVGRA